MKYWAVAILVLGTAVATSCGDEPAETGSFQTITLPVTISCSLFSPEITGGETATIDGLSFAIANQSGPAFFAFPTSPSPPTIDSGTSGNCEVEGSFVDLEFSAVVNLESRPQHNQQVRFVDLTMYWLDRPGPCADNNVALEFPDVTGTVEHLTPGDTQTTVNLGPPTRPTCPGSLDINFQ